MPTYNYKCSKCGNIFDIEATLQEKEEGGKKFVCSKCGSKEIKQKFSATHFIKNIFASDSAGGCCGSGNTCGPDCKTEDKKNTKNNSCCG